MVAVPRAPLTPKRRSASGGRVLWLAVAEARGHLVRAHLARALIAEVGIEVEIVTTSDAGRRFLAALGVPSTVLSDAYALVFDDDQNLARRATERQVLRYLAGPGAADLVRLLRRTAAGGFDLVVNDSFHPALFLAPLAVSLERLPVVNVFGENMLAAVAEFRGQHGLGGSYARAVHAVAGRALACVQPTLAALVEPTAAATLASARTLHLPPLLPPLSRTRSETRRALGVAPHQKLATVYLNPHFRSEALATSLERALLGAGFAIHAIGEGYRGRPGWRAADYDLPAVIAASDLVVSAPGMGCASIALAAGVPFLGLLSDQPEQRRNAEVLRRSALAHAFVELGAEPGALRAELHRAAAVLARAPPRPPDTAAFSRARAAWRDAFVHLIATRRATTGAAFRGADHDHRH